jgi:hypothetical protein
MGNLQEKGYLQLPAPHWRILLKWMLSKQSAWKKNRLALDREKFCILVSREMNVVSRQ